MKSARLFAAVAFSPEEKRELAGVSRLVREHCPAGRFVPPDLYHVTLHFFGQTCLSRLPAIESAMKQAAASARPFTMATGRAGSFGRADSAVVWLGIGDGARELAALQSSLGQALAAQGFPAEARPFRAHVTLARDSRPDANVSSLELPIVRLYADKITLMESSQAGGKLEYIPLLAVPLSKESMT